MAQNKFIEILSNYFPLFDGTKIQYFREENQVNATVIPLNSLKTEYKLLNSTTVLVLELADGTRSVGDICSCFIERYPDVPERQIREDIASVVLNLWIGGITGWKNGEYPLMDEFVRRISPSTEETVRLAFDEDAKDILEYISEHKDAGVYHDYLQKINIDFALSLRYSLFSMNRAIFLIESGSGIKALVSIGIYQSSTAAVIEDIFGTVQDFEMSYPHVEDLFKKCNVGNCTKIKLFLRPKKDDELRA